MAYFHEKLKELRKERKLTQEEVATALGLKRSTYSLYESGKREPNFETMRKMAYFFDVTMDALIGYKIRTVISLQMPERLEEEKRNTIIAIFNTLSSHGKAEAPYLLEAFSSLNSTGQTEAVKRMRELSKIEGYRKGDPEYDPDPPCFD